MNLTCDDCRFTGVRIKDFDENQDEKCLRIAYDNWEIRSQKSSQ